MSEGKDVGAKDELGVGGAEEEVVEATGEDGESHVAVEPAPGAVTELVCGDNNRADGDDKGDGEEESLMTNNSDQPNEVVAEEVRAVDEEGGVGLMGLTNSEMEGTGDGVGENLGERKECEKGSDENGLGEDLGGIAIAVNGVDSRILKEDSSKGVVSDHVENIDEAKENIVEEANFGGQGDTVKAEETLSGQVKTEDMKHNGECTENVEVRTQVETEEEVEKKTDIDEAEAVQSKEDIELKPLHEGNKMITEHLTEENGSTKSLVFDFNSLDGDDSGEEDEQSVFMQELENFFKERNLEFKPPKFYGEGLNCLKLWRAVIRLGGYDQVTTCKLWRQVGESFNPPKTCTTISWSFRCFYEKVKLSIFDQSREALLDYERYMVQTGELQFPPASFSLPSGAENQVGSSQPGGSGRARRDAAARAMQGWHSQRLVGNEEEKSAAALSKHEKQLKTLNAGKRKRQSSDEQAVRVARTKTEDQRDGQAGSPVSVKEISIKDIGPAAEWVKINVRKNAECWEVYALVPGLLREEVRVQSDPAGCLVISGEPEQPDNPWGVHPFKKVITLPSRINPHQTSAVVTLHGQLFVRAPFEQ